MDQHRNRERREKAAWLAEAEKIISRERRVETRCLAEALILGLRWFRTEKRAGEALEAIAGMTVRDGKDKVEGLDLVKKLVAGWKNAA